jgi:hypothetical protein
MLFPVAQVLARATRRRRTRQSADRPLRAIRVPAAVLASVYVLSVLTHGLGATACSPPSPSAASGCSSSG